MLMIPIFSSFSNNVQIDKWNASKLNINKKMSNVKCISCFNKG